MPRQEHKELETWTEEETSRFLAATADSPYAMLWKMYLATGARRGELLGATWADVDLDAAR